MKLSRQEKFSVLIWGLSGLTGIALVFYFVQVLGMQDWWGPWYFWQYNWYFISPLVIGFAVQMGLFRAIHLNKQHHGGGAMVVSGGVSTGAMIACCMHNFVSLLPIIGLTGLAVFLSAYQSHIFIISILFMLGGIIYMSRKYQEAKNCARID